MQTTICRFFVRCVSFSNKDGGMSRRNFTQRLQVTVVFWPAFLQPLRSVSWQMALIGVSAGHSVKGEHPHSSSGTEPECLEILNQQIGQFPSGNSILHFVQDSQHQRHFFINTSFYLFMSFGSWAANQSANQAPYSRINGKLSAFHEWEVREKQVFCDEAH